MTNDPQFAEPSTAEEFVCFSNSKKISEGSLGDVALTAWNLAQSDPTQSTLTFNRETGAVVDLNLSGTSGDVASRYSVEPEAPPKRGRPKLGVTAREVTLLPRHWDWLAQQPGGASVTLRRLVEAARKSSQPQETGRNRLAATYKFMTGIGGDLPSFEDASRALFARQFDRFDSCLKEWPPDIRAELKLFLQGLAIPTER